MLCSCQYTVHELRVSAYQTEIDNLTKRSKFAENAFLNVYKVLAEAPDPYPFLEAAVVRLLYSPTCILVHRVDSRTKPSKLPKHVNLRRTFRMLARRMRNCAGGSMRSLR